MQFAKTAATTPMTPMVFDLCYCGKTSGHDIELCGGNGIGQVTKPGLACAVGGPAINPTPRRMIIDELTKVMTSADYQAGLKVTIAAPAGVEIAKKLLIPGWVF